MSVPKQISDYMKELQKKSWEARKGKQDMADAGRKGALKRWGNKKKNNTEKST